jgi:uncharacterized protein YjdB
MKRVIGILTVLLLIGLAACQDPIVTQNGGASAGDHGSLDLAVSGSGPVASVLGRSTILPVAADTAIAKYTAAGTGPAGSAPVAAECQPPAYGTGANFSFPALEAGSWTFLIKGLDAAGNSMVEGSLTVEIAKNVSVSKTVALSPVSGTGSLGLTVSWPAGKVVDAVSGALTPATGAAIPVALTVSDQSATGTVSNLPTGNYLLVLNIRNGGSNVTSPRMEGVVVYKDKTSVGSFPLVAADFDYTPVSGVSFAKGAVSLAIDSSATLSAVVAPASATLPTLLWSSSDTAVATVDDSGLVKALALGSATITATSVDGNRSASCALTVCPALTGLNKVATGLLVGGTEQLVVLTNPAGASATGVTWKTNDAAVATVNAGGLVTGVGAGTTMITATSADENSLATCTITVSTSAILVTGVTVTPAVFSLLRDQKAQLAAATTPTDATNQNVTWSSSDPAVATVDSQGKVTAVSPGKATITVTSVDGGKTATSTAYVSTASWLMVDRSPVSIGLYNNPCSSFSSVRADGAGNVYALGTAYNAFDFGNGLASSGYIESSNILTKFNARGEAQWAKLIKTYDASITSMVADSAGNTYLLGVWNSAYASTDYTGGVAWGTGTAFLLKFDASGAVQWAQPLIRNTGVSLRALAIDASGNLYLAGSISGTGTYQFVGGFSLVGTASSQNPLVVKCNSDGTVKWAKSVTQGTQGSWFDSVAVDGSGNVLAAGWFGGNSPLVTDTYGFGNGVSASGVGFGLVKYSASGAALWAQMTTVSGYGYTNGENTIRVAVDSVGAAYLLVGNSYLRGTLKFDGSHSLVGSGTNIGALVKYDANGSVQWLNELLKNAGYYYSATRSVVVDSSDNVLVGGQIPNAGTYSLGGASLDCSAGSLFWAKYSSAGVGLDAQLLSGDSVKAYNTAYLAVSGTNVYLVGNRSSPMTMMGGAKAFLVKY